MNETCCFTGHRSIPQSFADELNAKLQVELIRLAELGVKNFKVGGALGFDTVCANAVLKLKQDVKDIKLNLILPCPQQDKYWTDGQKKEYNNVISVADTVEYVSDYYFGGCMQMRNRRLVDGSEYCIAYLRKPYGGTFYTVNYAKNKGVNVIEI